MTAKKSDIDPDPKSLKNPINQQNEPSNPREDFNPAYRGDKPKPVTEDEIRFLNTTDPENPKNKPRK